MTLKFMAGKSLLIMIALATLCLNVTAQTYKQQRIQVASFNIISSGITGAVGTLIHKKSSETKGHALLRGFAKGSLSGLVILAGKEITGYARVAQRYDYILCGKLTHAVGASMLENTATNEKLFYNLGIDFGPVRFDTKRGVRFQPFASGCLVAIAMLSRGFNLRLTLLSGTPIFNYKPKPGFNALTLANSFSFDNKAYVNTGKYNNKYNVISHEIIHTFQYRESQAITHMIGFNKSKHIYWDVPFNFINWYIGDLSNKEYYGNYYEMEAHLIASGEQVK